MTTLISSLPGPSAPDYRFTAWQLIGWEGDCGTVARLNGRKTYSDVMHNCATARADNVKLARLESGPREVSQWVGADEVLKVVTMTERGRTFLIGQNLIPA